MTSAPLRVAFVAGNIFPLLSGESGVPFVGGAEVQQLEMARALATRGVEIVWVTEDHGQGSDCRVDGARVLAYRYGRDKIRQATTLWRALKRASADVYYVRGAPKFLSILLLHAISGNRPLVLGMSTNQMTHPRRATGQSRVEHLAYRLALRKSAAVVAQTETQRALLERHYALRSVTLIPNGTPSGRSEASITPRPSTVVWLASLLPYKGIERLFEVARLCPDLTFEIHGAPGRGQANYAESVRREAGMLPNVRWCGPLERAAVDETLAGALALVNTTIPFSGVDELEGFPNVYLEAWRNGVPTCTLTNDPDGIIERHGLGVRAGSVPALAAALRSLAAEPALRAAQGAAARAYVEREHALPRIAESWLTLFRRVAGRA